MSGRTITFIGYQPRTQESCDNLSRIVRWVLDEQDYADGTDTRVFTRLHDGNVEVLVSAKEPGKDPRPVCEFGFSDARGLTYGAYREIVGGLAARMATGGDEFDVEGRTWPAPPEHRPE